MKSFAHLTGRRIVREGIWVGTGQSLAALGSLVGLRILTEVSTPPAYGELALLLGVSSLAKNLFFAPFTQAAIRFYPDASLRARVGGLRRLMLGLVRTSGAVLAAVLFLVGAVWSALSRSWIPIALLLAVGLFVTFDAMKDLEINLLNVARRRRVFSVWSTLDAWSKPLAATLAAWVLGVSGLSLLSGYVLGVGGTYTILRQWRVRDGAPGALSHDEPWECETRAQVLHYGWPFAALALLGWMSNLGDRYLLAGISGVGAAGLYSATYGLGSWPFIMLGGLISTTLLPVFFEADAQGDLRKVRRIFLLWLVAVCALGTAGVLLLWLFGGLVVRVVLGEAFRGGTLLLPWIAAAYALQSVQQAFETIIYLRRRTKLFILQYGVAALSSAVFYLVLIPPMGASGAAIATFLASAVTCGVTFAMSGAATWLIRGGEGIPLPVATSQPRHDDRGTA